MASSCLQTETKSYMIYTCLPQNHELELMMGLYLQQTDNEHDNLANSTFCKTEDNENQTS